MNATRIELLADEIIHSFAHAGPGHCARVDYLERSEAVSVCQALRGQDSSATLIVRILQGAHNDTNNDLYITTDEAIEIRNRKTGCLCLFVPSDLVDATVSSLANSFAVIDGRELHRAAIDRLLKRLSPEAQQTVRAVFQRLRSTLRVSNDERLDFVTALFTLDKANEWNQVGRELWRVGLIADARVDFVQRLDANRAVANNLARPARLQASATERIATTGVDAETSAKLTTFFRGRAMHDVKAWSHALAEGAGPTFDEWTFPRQDPSDIQSVTVIPFLTREGGVEKYTRLAQPDGLGGSLIAHCGPKGTLVVKWKSDPLQPRNLARWRIEIVPNEYEPGDAQEDLPSREVAGSMGSTTLKLDLDIEEPLDFAVLVRVTALDTAGNPLKNKEDKVVKAISDEFYLVPDNGQLPESSSRRESRRTVPTLAFGRLEAALELGEHSLVETQPQWLSKEQDYFSLRLHERRTVNIGFSHSLLELERQVIGNTRNCGYFMLEVDEVRPVAVDAFTQHLVTLPDRPATTAFMSARENFFNRLNKAQPRDVIEAADWNSELANAAVRHCKTYRELVDDLIATGGAPNIIRQVLSIDTVLVRIRLGQDRTEDGLVILPTHPLRAAWIASYTQLLGRWEQQVLERAGRERKFALDLSALHMLTPANLPAFAFHAESDEGFVFFQNFRFFHGVALPADNPDPHGRFADIATLLGVDPAHSSVADLQPERLAEHLKRFVALHPYAKNLVATLINLDRGEFFANALENILHKEVQPDADEADSSVLTWEINSYVDDPRRSLLPTLEQLRQFQFEGSSEHDTDLFLPALTTNLRSLAGLNEPPDAHIAVVSDFTDPRLRAVRDTLAGAGTSSSYSFYGLITRFMPGLTTSGHNLSWCHRIVSEGLGRPEDHPAGPRYTETLVELQNTLLKAGGYILSGDAGAYPMLEITLDDDRHRLLDRLHTSSTWVITLDRFFALDYYDSPHDPLLSNIARKYVLDYSPEFAEGLGHRMLVTTAWYAELESLLGRAMDELGFAAVESSVSRLLHYLKTVSGHLALQAFESSSAAAAAVGLGVVTAWLQNRGRLKQALLIPVDPHPRLFTGRAGGAPTAGERRCDLVLIGLKRNIVDATFIEVKWRRGRAPLEELAHDMLLQMQGSADAMKTRFFDEARIDGALQRAYLANVLRFYFERARRYGLFEPDAEASFLEHLNRLEKASLQWRPSYEGYIVSLDDAPRKPFQVEDAKVTVLTERDFEESTEFSVARIRSQDMPDEPLTRASETEISPSTLPKTLSEQGVAYAMDDLIHPEIPVAIPVARDGVTNQTPAQSESAPDTELSIPLGETLDGQVDWTLSVKGSPHLFIIGIPGQGKSWTITRILTELRTHQIPALVLDFHGQFTNQPSSSAGHLAPTIIDAAMGLPFSPFEVGSSGGANDWRANTLAIAEIFSYVVGLGEMQRDVVYQAVRAAYQAHGFGQDSLENLSYPTLEEVRKRIADLERTQRTQHVSARLRPVLEMDLFRPVSDGPDLLTQIRQGLVIDLHNLYAEALQVVVGAFVLRKLYKDMFQWGTADRLRLVIVLDEAHRLARDITLPKIMKEGRKFGIAVIVASQGLADFHPDVLGNAGTKVIFRTNYPESRKIAGFIRARHGQDLSVHIEQLAIGSAYVQTPEMSHGALVRMYPIA